MKKIDFKYFLVILENLKELAGSKNEIVGSKAKLDKETKEAFLERTIELKEKILDDWNKMTQLQRKELLQRFQIVETMYDRRKELEEL